MHHTKANRFLGNNAWYVNGKGEVVVIPDCNQRFVFPIEEMEKAIKAAAAVSKHRSVVKAMKVKLENKDG
jgi:hypothetical protein